MEGSLVLTSDITLVGPPGVGKTTDCHSLRDQSNGMASYASVDEEYLRMPREALDKREVLNVQSKNLSKHEIHDILFPFEVELFSRKVAALSQAVETGGIHVIDGGLITSLVYVAEILMRKCADAEEAEQYIQEFLAKPEIHESLRRFYTDAQIIFLVDTPQNIRTRIEHRYADLPFGSEKEARAYELHAHTVEKIGVFLEAQDLIMQHLQAEPIQANVCIVSVSEDNVVLPVAEVTSRIATDTCRRAA